MTIFDKNRKKHGKLEEKATFAQKAAKTWKTGGKCQKWRFSAKIGKTSNTSKEAQIRQFRCCVHAPPLFAEMAEFACVCAFSPTFRMFR